MSDAENKESSDRGDSGSRGGRSPPLCSSGKSSPSGPISGRAQKKRDTMSLNTEEKEGSK